MTVEQIEACCHLAGFGFGSIFWLLFGWCLFGGGK